MLSPFKAGEAGRLSGTPDPPRPAAESTSRQASRVEADEKEAERERAASRIPGRSRHSTRPRAATAASPAGYNRPHAAVTISVGPSLAGATTGTPLASAS